jgi:hypothetical protein
MAAPPIVSVTIFVCNESLHKKATTPLAANGSTSQLLPLLGSTSQFSRHRIIRVIIFPNELAGMTYR